VLAGGDLTEEQNDQETRKITGQRFDKPLFVAGGVSEEPERYLAEKPYELSKFEFSILRKGSFKSESWLWLQLVTGATAGFILALLGKALNALIQKQTPSLENWELWSAGVGILLTLILAFTSRFKKKTPDEKEFAEIKEYIDQYFKETPRRRIHVTGRKESQK
jgi:hypothetical protein